MTVTLASAGPIEGSSSALTSTGTACAGGGIDDASSRSTTLGKNNAPSLDTYVSKSWPCTFNIRLYNPCSSLLSLSVAVIPWGARLSLIALSDLSDACALLTLAEAPLKLNNNEINRSTPRIIAIGIQMFCFGL